MTILTNIEKVEKLLEQVRAHCMCAKFEDDGRFLVVIYPEGDFRTDGARCDYSQMGKATALERLLNAIEKEWVASYPNAKVVQ